MNCVLQMQNAKCWVIAPNILCRQNYISAGPHALCRAQRYKWRNQIKTKWMVAFPDVHASKQKQKQLNQLKCIYNVMFTCLIDESSQIKSETHSSSHFNQRQNRSRVDRSRPEAIESFNSYSSAAPLSSLLLSTGGCPQPAATLLPNCPNCKLVHLQCHVQCRFGSSSGPRSPRPSSVHSGSTPHPQNRW